MARRKLTYSKTKKSISINLSQKNTSIDNIPDTCSTLTDNDLNNLSHCVKKACGYNLCLFQTAGIRAQLEGRDIIIQASTGSGKTLIAAGPHFWPGSEGKITIMVSPLMVLEDEMV